MYRSRRRSMSTATEPDVKDTVGVWYNVVVLNAGWFADGSSGLMVSTISMMYCPGLPEKSISRLPSDT